MSQDGKGQVIPVDVISDQPPDGFDCSCGGWVYSHGRDQFRKCSRGTVHCLDCQGVAKRFRKGWTCNHKGSEEAA